MDWEALFGIHVPIPEIIVRGSAVYWFLFLIFRFILRRDVGAVGIADVLLLVLIADAAQNAMAAEYRSITEGLILVSTIVGWNWALDWLSSKSRRLARVIAPQALVLVRNGRVLRDNLQREMLTLEDLKSRLRLQGVEHIADVKLAHLEEDGQISVIRWKDGERRPSPERSRP
ncbi:MAG TPA: YetF domain-containing protein [Steroidobacteraceae bacterium]|nr:YetF domain-containing protein [Steroidobacteraceae bacterium]